MKALEENTLAYEKIKSSKIHLDQTYNSITNKILTKTQTQKKALTPFLKWAGGKRWLVEKHPNLLCYDFERYIEPFAGSGAVFFNLLPNKSILCDKNKRLIEVYHSIKHCWEKVESLLRTHHKMHSKEYYYATRIKKMRTPETRAAQFIYLNRTCWNGLYRVNKKGQFNVPIGTKQNVLLSSDNFEAISNSLSNTTLIAGDFEMALKIAKHGDFVFIDPPYKIQNEVENFIKYNENIFSWEDQLRLRDKVKEAVLRGAKVLVTNACHESIKGIYEGIGEIITLDRANVISGRQFARGRYEEIVIKCY